MAIQVNGKQIHSDKSVRSIVGTRVEFDDGSWCDVSTGQVVNKGTGYITIGAHPGDAAGPATTRGPERFNPQPLDIRNVNADVNVEIHPENSIEVTIVGPENSVKKIRVTEQCGCLLIESDEDKKGGGNTIITGGGRGNVVIGGTVRGMTIVSGSSIVIGGSGGNAESDVKITVRVPKGNPVSVASIEGNTVIGDIEADLTVNVTTSGNVQAGRVKTVNLNIQGHGDVDVAEVQGNFSAQVMGHGSVKVKAGNMPSVMANVMGHGSVKIKGKAQNASLTVMGHGSINVQHVENKPMTSVMGHGDINVGNW